MYDAKGVGLAAPQIGIDKQIIIVAPPDEEPMRSLSGDHEAIHHHQSVGRRLLVRARHLGFVRRANSLTVKGLTPKASRLR